MAQPLEDAFNIPGLSGKFADPFLLPSNAFIPKDLQSAMDFCLFLYHLNSNYRRASQRVIAHFVTDLDFMGEQGDQEERDELYDYLKDGLDLFGAIMTMGEEWACFAGETLVTTEGGVFQIRDLTGQTVKVLSKDGVYREACFKSYGTQPLMEVSFKDGRSIFATPEHKWEVLNGGGETVEVTTEELKISSHRIKRTVAPRPEKNEEYLEGVRHGFIYGDGSMSSKNKRTTAMFCGDKDEIMLKYFEGHGNAPRPRTDKPYKCIRQSGFPAHYKSLPPRTQSASYWYGFVSGFFAADGHVDPRDGCAVLAQADKTALEAVIEQLPRIGMIAGPLGGPAIKDSIFTRPDGSQYVCEGCECYRVQLLRNTMQPDDFLIQQHRDNFVSRQKPDSKYGQYMSIKSVTKTDRVEEVFCCEEMETHRIVVGQGVLTGQCFGNSFWRIFFPFDRYLIDDRDNSYAEYSLSMFGNDAKFDLTTMTYEVTDPRDAARASGKRRRISFEFRDRRSTSLKRIKLCPLDPRQVRLQHSWISKKTRVVYQFETWFTKQIKEGRLHQVNDTPIDMLKAIQADEDFLFDEDQVFHCKAPTISGISNNGWGIPEPILNYRNLHQLQVYRKIDEAVGLDYMLPFRLFSPNLGDKAVDPSMYQNLGLWSSNIQKLIGNRRKDPSKMHAFPFPVNYQEFGAEGKNLTPKDLIEFQTNDMLDSMGYPAELFRGSLSVQQIPTALRLFENTFHFLHRNFDQFTRWVVRRTLDYLNREQIGISLQLPSIANDLEERHIYLQLAAGGEISRSKAYHPFNIKDPIQEAKERMQEDIEIQREQQKIQADFEREMTQGSADQIIAGQMQGQPAGPAQGGSTTPLDIMTQAEEQAAQLLQVESDGERSKLLRQIQASNPTLHAAVKQQMEVMRSQGASQGRASVGQQPAQGQQPPQGG
jgi:hypothetical protein